MALDAIEARRQHRRLEQIGIGIAIGQPQLQPLVVGQAHHVGAVIAAIADPAGRPGGPGNRGASPQTGIAVETGIGDRAEPRGVFQQAAQELVGEAGQPQGAAGIDKAVASAIPEGEVQVAAVAGELGKGFGPEAGPQAVALRQGGHHHPKECMPIGGGERIGKGPVDLKLAVGVFVIGLVGSPAKTLHRLQDLADQRIVTHQGQLVVAGFALLVGRIADRLATGIQQEKLRFHAGHQAQAQGLGALQLPLQHPPR